MNDVPEIPTALNPWKSIWTKPRTTVQYLVNTNPEYMVLPLAALSGIVQALGNASNRDMSDSINFIALLLIIAFVGPISSVFSLFIGSGLLSLTGKWMGGVGNSRNIRTAIAWSGIPALCLLPMWILMIAWLGEALFYPELLHAKDSALSTIGTLCFALLQIVLGVWALVLFFQALGQVQGFSAWRAVGNTLFALTLVVIPVFVITMVLGGMGA